MLTTNHGIYTKQQQAHSMALSSIQNARSMRDIDCRYSNEQLCTQHVSTAANAHRAREAQQRQRVADSMADVADVDAAAAHLSSHRVGPGGASKVWRGSDFGLAVDGHGRAESSS